MKKSIIFLTILFVFIGCFSINVNALETTNTIELSDETVRYNGTEIGTAVADVYVSSELNNGGTSDSAKSANISVSKVVNIQKEGTYVISGTLSNGMIAINTNNINGEVKIILSNASITCKSAPAILVYNKATSSDNCTVVISTVANTENTLTGGKIKQSVEGWIDQSDILFSIEKNYDDEGVYFERYKYDGAISSDISLTLEGEGTMTINAKKEGIETKKDLTINSGNIIINSGDDGINASADYESVITINGGTILAKVNADAEEGDGIDSNGYLYINGGNVYGFANPNSEDSGVDADLGIYVNGGVLVATGNMFDGINSNSKQNNVTFNFNESIEADTLIAVKDESNNVVAAFKTDRTYKVITISISKIGTGTYTAYKGGTIIGTSINGLYTDITSYIGGTELTTNMDSTQKSMMGMDNRMFNPDNQINSSNYYISIVILVIVLLISVIISIMINKKNEKAFKVLLFVQGIFTGAIIALVIVVLCMGTSIKQGENQGINDGTTPPDLPSNQGQQMMKPDGTQMNQKGQQGLVKQNNNEI